MDNISHPLPRSQGLNTRGRKEMFYLTMHSTHFIYGYMASNIWLRSILIVRKETHCRHIGYSFQLTAKVLLYAPSHRQDCTYHSRCYTSHGALAGTRNSSMKDRSNNPSHHERTLLPRSYISHLTPKEIHEDMVVTLGENAPLYSMVKKWNAEFKHGRDSLEDDPH